MSFAVDLAMYNYGGYRLTDDEIHTTSQGTINSICLTGSAGIYASVE